MDKTEDYCSCKGRIPQSSRTSLSCDCGTTASLAVKQAASLCRRNYFKLSLRKNVILAAVNE
jgi:hypothetical protein